MTTLDPRALEAAAEAVGRHIHYSRPSHNCHRCRRTAESAITAYLAVTQPTVNTVEELEGLPAQTIIKDASGRARRREGAWWTDATTESYTHKGPEHWGLLPARVIWRPHESP